MPTERRVLIWMCVLVGTNQLGFGSLLPVLPHLAESYGVAAWAVGLTIGIYGLARMALAMPAGRLSDYLGRRPTLAIGALISAVGSFWCAVATSYPEFVAARFVSGAGAGLVLTAGQIVLADISTPARRGRIMSIYQGTFIFAVGIGPLLGGLLADSFGMDAPFVAYGVASAVAALVAQLFVAETREMDTARRTTGPAPAFLTQIRSLLGNVGFFLVCLVAFIHAVARTGGLFNIVPVIGSVRLGLSYTQVGFGMAAGIVIGLLIAYPAGVLTDRFGRKVVIVPSTIFTGLSLLLFCFAPSYAWFVVACLAWGTASSIGSAAPGAYAADTAPPGMNASTMSTYRMLGDVGYFVGPITLGLVVDGFGANTALVLAAALLVLAGLAFAVFAPESYRGGKG